MGQVLGLLICPNQTLFLHVRGMFLPSVENSVLWKYVVWYDVWRDSNLKGDLKVVYGFVMLEEWVFSTHRRRTKANTALLAKNIKHIPMPELLHFFILSRGSCRFVDKYSALKSNSELDDSALFEQTGKVLLAEGVVLRKRGAPPVSRSTWTATKHW